MAKVKRLKRAASRAEFVKAYSRKAWTPRDLPGGVYCSPACGGGCLKRDFREAERKSDALAKKLGGGFIPHVWENRGWHWSARQLDRANRGRLIAEVCQFGKAYRADLYVGGLQFVGRGASGPFALGDAMAKARKAAAAVVKDLAHV